MIDFHSHIIPGVDDGAKSVEETFELIKEAESVGFDSIISTSHYIENYYESSVEERTEWINALSEALKKENINMNLYLGNEVYFSENIIHLLNENKIAKINNSRYMLFEFAMNVIRFLDKHGILPKFLIRVSPFHTSAFVTNVGSLGIDAIFHHLYNFGTTSMFFAMEEKKKLCIC